MTIRLRPIEDPKRIGNWVLPKTPPFLQTVRFKGLSQDLTRYVNGDITGRSFLIAGHRGSGKTSLVGRAVQDVRQRQIEDSARGVLDVPQRPMIVRLYGPSLTSELAPTQSELAEKAARGPSAAGASTPEDSGTTGQPTQVKADDAGLKSTQAALVQITIALYRALANEIADGFSVHAREIPGAQGLIARELAGQLALELDSATSPSLLRAYWRRLGRLQSGVLWPSAADGVLGRLEPGEQGVREIIAIATASQAFEVCSGAVTFTETSKRTAREESEVKGAGKADIRDLIARLGSLGLGAITGSALWGVAGGTAAVTVGLAVWLLGTTSLSWSFGRRRQVDHALDYTFIRDRSVQTLDRDLPLVIRRVREAGLAPVFVIDELDKLPEPHKTIGEIIDRLKHIVADNGFFCFLADRNYFDHVEQMAEIQAYPKEHTYFSERRLIVYTPREFKKFIVEQLVLSDAGDANEHLVSAIYATWLTYRAKLNFANLTREFARLWPTADDGGDVTQTISDIAGQPDVLLGVTMQLAIDFVLAEADLAARIERDAGFAQMAYDALYAVARCWDAGEAEYDASKSVLEGYLRTRWQLANGMDAPKISVGDLDMLTQANGRLIRLLTNLPAFVAELGGSGLDFAELAFVPPTEANSAILKAKRGETTKFTFRVDAFGRQLVNQRRGDKVEIDELVALARQMGSLLEALQVSIADLTAAQLLPPMSWPNIEAAVARLEAWLPSPFPDREANNALLTLRNLNSALREHGDRLAAGLRLARILLADSDGASFQDCLRILARFPVVGMIARKIKWSAAKFADQHPDFPRLDGSSLTNEPDGFATWQDEFLAWRPSGLLPEVDTQVLWDDWRTHILEYLETMHRGRPHTRQLRRLPYAELVAAVRGQRPSALLRCVLNQVSRFEWSRIVLEALPSERNGPLHAPTWILVAALRALGFSHRVLTRLLDETEKRRDTASDPYEFAMAGITQDLTGLMVVYNDVGDGTPLVPASDAAALHVSHSERQQFEIGLDWLADLGVIEGVIEQHDEI